MRGSEIRVAELDGNELHGTALGITDEGALEVEQKEGGRVQVLAGDVTLVRPESNPERSDGQFS